MQTNNSDFIFPIRNLKMAEGKEQSLHRVLQSVVPLDNGEYGYVYRDLGAYKSEKKYMCNVCKRVLIFSKSVLSHNVHPTHKISLRIPMHDSANFPQTTPGIPRDCPTPSDDEIDVSDEVTEEEPSVKPGEPIPPGLEDVVDSVCQIQSTFDHFTSGPLIGLEYIVELISIVEPDAEPRYICLLCEKKGDPRSVMVHVTSYNHYLKYICCFFRTVGNKLNLIPKTSTNRSAINTAIIKVAEAIEKQYGRLKPTSTEMEKFASKKYEILKEIDEKEHFRETPQLTFLELVTAAKLEEYAKAPVVNFNTKDLDAKNEEMTKKCIENNQKIASIKSLDKKTDKAPDTKVVKSSDNVEPKKVPAKAEALNSQNLSKKLSIALNKPERSIPGISKPQVQNIDIIVKKENDDDENGDENKDDDDVIILADSKKDPVEVHSLSSVSSRSRSWSRGRYGNRGRSRSPRRRTADRPMRSRSRDRFGRIRRDSRESSYDRYRRDRDWRDERDRREREFDDRGRRDYDDRRRRDFDDRNRKDGSRGYRSNSRGHRGDSRDRRENSRGRRYDSRGVYRSSSRGRREDSRGRRGDSRGHRGDSRDRYSERSRYDDRRRMDDCRDYDRSREKPRNPTPDRYRNDYSSYRDKNYESEDRNLQISDEIKRKNRWNTYKEELTKLEEDLDKTYKFYQGHPEKHPSYNDEWKAFWNRRYKEIQMSGQDPSKYDFKPEWILFWEKKMKEIHDQKVVSEKETLKRKHNFDSLHDVRGDRDLQDISPPTPDVSKDVTVNDIKKTWKAMTGTEINARKRPSSPWESKPKEKETSKDNDVGITSQQFFAPTKRPATGVTPVPPVIHCLRMLSVLENQIGFQASRVIDLLAQGLALEKTKVNHSMTLLQNKDIYLFFEAMKEKLRGQLMAGIVQRHLVSATRNVIKTIEGILELNPLKPEVFEPVTIPGVGDVDKVAVAQKIAGALIKMGKTNVSTEELEQLINAVVGMATASSVSADVSSDKFFSQLNIKNSNASSHINSIISSLIQTAQQSVCSSSSNIIPELNPENKDPSNLGNVTEVENNMADIKSSDRGPSPFSLRSGGINPIQDKYEDKKEDDCIGYDEDDDDYSFEDVYHAAQEKLKKSEENKSSLTQDENSQTQSSATSVQIPKNSGDILSSIDSSTLSNLAAYTSQQTSKEPESLNANTVNDISKSINLNDLRSLLSQTQALEKPGIDMSLVESIKDTLVQSFSQNSQQSHGSDNAYTGYGNVNDRIDRTRERPTLDPRNRGVWDPRVKQSVENFSGTDYTDPRMSIATVRGEGDGWNGQSRDDRQWAGREPWKDQRAWSVINPWEQGYSPQQYNRPPNFGSNPQQQYTHPEIPPYPPYDPNQKQHPPFL